MNKDPLSLAQIIGYMAMCCSVSSFGFKSNRHMNMLLVASNTFWVIHFGLLGAFAGLFNQAVSGLRSLIFVIQNDQRRRMGYF